MFRVGRLPARAGVSLGTLSSPVWRRCHPLLHRSRPRCGRTWGTICRGTRGAIVIRRGVVSRLVGRRPARLLRLCSTRRGARVDLMRRRRDGGCGGMWVGLMSSRWNSRQMLLFQNVLVLRRSEHHSMDAAAMRSVGVLESALSRCCSMLRATWGCDRVSAWKGPLVRVYTKDRAND